MADCRTIWRVLPTTWRSGSPHAASGRPAPATAGEVGPGRGSGLSTGPFPRSRFPNRACDLHRTRLSTSPGGSVVVSSSGGAPWSGNRPSPVVVARGAYLGRVEQHPVLAGLPRSAAAVVAEDLPPARLGVLALDPPPDRVPQVVAQVGEGRGGHPGPEVGAPA